MRATVWVAFVVLQPLFYWCITASVGLTIWFVILGALFALICTTPPGKGEPDPFPNHHYDYTRYDGGGGD
jgi:hypothetical protein